MKFISCGSWRDLTDGHLYREGEPFPFDGREIAPERLDELENGHNRAGLVLIRALGSGNEVRKARKEEEPEQASEGQKTAKPRTRRVSKAKK
jgi:hypothetical protein